MGPLLGTAQVFLPTEGGDEHPTNSGLNDRAGLAGVHGEAGEPAAGTLAFRFAKPPGWTFEAGQFIDMDLIDLPRTDAAGNTRGFSIASAPFEDTTMIASRMRDTAFKQVLKTLPIRAAGKIEGPFGKPDASSQRGSSGRGAVGRDWDHPVSQHPAPSRQGSPAHRIFFFYANRRPEDAPFLDDMRAVERENPNFTFIPKMGEMDKSSLPWDGETGRIDASMLSRHLTGLVSPIYYVTGPPGMVKGMQAVLKSTGVDSDDIRVEEFTGY